MSVAGTNVHHDHCFCQHNTGGQTICCRCGTVQVSQPPPCVKCGSSAGWTGPQYHPPVEIIDNVGRNAYLGFTCRTCGYIRHEPCVDARESCVDARGPNGKVSSTIKFTAHCPGYIDGFSHKGVQGTLAEILADPWVASWSKSPRFYRWSLSEECLIAEQDGGDSQWVIGYLDPPPVGELPVWVESAKARERREKWNRGE